MTRRAPETIRVPLYGGELHAIVDAVDAERVLRHRWRAVQRKQNHTYAARGRATDDELLHRFIVGAKPGELVDHKDGDTLNNRRSNLRRCTASQNQQNVRSSKRQKLGGYKGVSANRNARKWEANCASGPVRANGKRAKRYLGLFTDPIQAAHAYDREAIRAFGEFASLNFEENRAAHCIDVGLCALLASPTAIRGRS